VFTELLDEIARLRAPGRRLLIGIAGAPGAGKSTLAEGIVAGVGDAVAVPMDGFHLSNGELRRLGLAQVKGAPQTFDTAGYVALLRRIKERPSGIIYAPSFDHVMNEPIAGSIPIFEQTSIVVTEGNYLLVWPQARELFDLTVHIDCDPQVRVAGLIARQRAKGLSAEAAHDWVMRSDEANARLVSEFAHLATLHLRR
jgi:pantothenate kinase